MAEVKRASFLGLSRELRLQIYEHVLQTNLNCQVIEIWRDDFIINKGFKSIPRRNQDASLKIPWLSLSRVCTSINTEMRSLLARFTPLTSDGSTANADIDTMTYTLDLELQWVVKNVVWRRIPCPPSKAKVLVANCFPDREFRAWGNGGPRPVVRGLYQTLTHFLHCGPLLDPTRPLSEHLKLHELVVHVHAPAKSSKDPEDEFDVLWPDKYPQLQELLDILHNWGFLNGYVERLRLTDGRKEKLWQVCDVPQSPVPAEWLRYGFQWEVGMDDKGGREAVR